MADTDGTIRLGVELDASDIIRSSKNLENRVSQIFRAAEGRELSASFQRLMNNMDRAVAKGAQLREKMEELRNTPSPEYSELTNQLNAATDALETLRAARDNIQNQPSMTQEDIEDLQLLNRQIDETVAHIDNIGASMEALEDSGMDYIVPEENIAQYERLENQLNNVNNTLRINIQAAQQSGEVGEQAAEQTGNMWQRTGEFIRTAFNHLRDGTLMASVFDRLADRGQRAGQAITRAFNGAGTAIRNLANHTGNAGNSLRNLGNSVRSVTKRLLALGLGISSLVALFTKLRGAITEGLQAMAQWRGGNNATNQSISMLISSLNYLKASLASAFAPILNVIAPILSYFMDMLARTAQMVGAFFAALTGKSTYVTASKMQTNYAATLNKSTGKTKKDTKETKKNTKAKKDNAKATKEQNDKLADFDDLNVLGTESQDDLNEALEDQPKIEEPKVDTPEVGGGGGGAPIAQFNEEEIPGWIQSLVDKIKQAWKNADFTEIGRIVGQKLRDALNDASEWLVNVAQPFAFKLGKSIATFLNGFFETPGLATALGKTIGELINTAIIGVSAFLDYTHWSNIGKFIADGLNSLINTIDWQKLGHMIAQGINAVFLLLEGFVNNFDWANLGNSISAGLNKAVADIKWKTIGTSLVKGFNGIVTAILNFVNTFDFKALGAGLGQGLSAGILSFDLASVWNAISGALAGVFEAITGFIQNFEWFKVGQFIVESAVNAIRAVQWTRLTESLSEMIGSAVGGLMSFYAGIGTKLIEFFTAAWNYARQWFYDVAFENGKFSISGLLNGIVAALSSIGQWIVDHIFTPFMNGFKAAFKIGSPSKVMEEMGVFLMEGLFNGINSLVSSVIELWNNLKTKILEVWNATKQKVQEITTNLKTEVENRFNSLKDKAIEIWNNLKTKVETTVNTFKTNVQAKVNELKEKVLEHFGNLQQLAEQIWTNLKNNVEGFVETFKENIKAKVNELKEKVLEHFGNIQKLGEQIWDNLKTNVEKLADTFKENIIGQNGPFATMKDKLVGDNGIITKLKESFIKIVEGIRDGVKSPLNAILGFFESLANGVIGGINAMISALNNFKIDIPEGLADLVGFDSFGFNLPQLNKITIPRLAQGAVIPANKEFLAVLGDQKQGTNIEAPLATIQEALRSVMAEQQPSTNATQNATMTLDGQVFARLVVPYIMDELNRRGYNVNVLES